MRGRRGDTLVNFAFLIGMLIIAAIVTVSITKLSLFQARALEQDALLRFSTDLRNTIEKTQSAPNDADFVIKLSYPLRYSLTVERGRLLIDFPQYDFQAEAIPFNSQSHVVGTSITDSGIIYVSKRGKTILISDSLKCDQSDIICDPGCIIQGKCDGACYQPFVQDVCNPFCLDKNQDGRIGREDLDGVCDPDCYGRELRGGAYDPDCLINNDQICDPSTDGVNDGFCDQDCVGTNGVCDPDCKAPDVDCPHQDNGFCETNRGESCLNEPADCSCDANLQRCMSACPTITRPANGCVDISSLRQEGDACTANCQCAPGTVCDTTYGSLHCCPSGEYFNGTACLPADGDGICGTAPPFNESCQSSPTDCACTAGGCCPNAAGRDIKGCVLPTQAEGQACVCDAECNNPLTCDTAGGRCCPAGKEWDAAKGSCEFKKRYRILFLPIFYDASSYPQFVSNADRGFDFFIQKSPFNTCAVPTDHIEKLIAPMDMCRSAEPSCSGPYVTIPGIPGTHSQMWLDACAYAMLDCVDASPFAGKWDKIIAFNNNAVNRHGPGAGGICGTAYGIPSPIGLTTSDSPCPDPDFEIAAGHEGGHTWGLYHITGNIGGNDCSGGGACMGPNGADCSLPNSERVGDIMTYCRINDHFGPAAYAYLKNTVFRDYLVGCP